MPNIKPDCYKCEYRGEVPGSAHSCCKHPAFDVVHKNPSARVFGILASAGLVPGLSIQAKECQVKGSQHGIRHGWFNHPFDFDPVWLEECSGFKKINK